MRLVTWNCFRGEPLQRFDRLSVLQPDIVVLQECSEPSANHDHSILWFGDNPRKGVAVVASPGYRVEYGPIDKSIADTSFPVVVTTPCNERIHLLAIWSKPTPTYVEAIAHGLDAYAEFLNATSSIIVGDFNSHARWDKVGNAWTHVRLVNRLKQEFRLTSAYHLFHAGLPEKPTFYWQWNENRQYHIDYCFVPLAWQDRICDVQIGNFTDWKSESDHRPMLIEIAKQADTIGQRPLVSG